MTIRTTVVGSYPKPPDEGQTFEVRRTLHALEQDEADTAELATAQDNLVRAVIAEQESAGVALVTDGQARWDDILTPFARHMAGFEVGGLLRFFDNNVYYRRPVCTGPIEWRGPSSIADYRFAAAEAKVPVKAVIPGPITFAQLSVDEHYLDHRAFVLAIASVLAQEAFELEAAGAPVIQIDEPALLGAPEDLALASEAIAVVVAELRSAQTVLATYFDDAKRLGRELFRFPVGGFGLDLVAGPDNAELVAELPAEKSLQAGIMDARNTRLEPVGDLVAQIEPLLEKVGAERLSVSPSCGLEYLPREKARAKLHRLVEAAQTAGG